MNIYVTTSLKNILATYQSIVAFLYQKVNQKQFTNTQLSVYTVDYSLLLPSSQFITNINAAQVNAQVQQYINLCDALVTYITNNVNLQLNFYYEQIQNTLNSSITQLDGFAKGLLNAQYASLLNYKVEYDMSLTMAMYINNISLDSYGTQCSLNYGISDFNNLLQNSTVTLTRA